MSIKTLFECLPNAGRPADSSTAHAARSAGRAAAWRQQISRAFSYQYQRVRSETERQALEAAYEQAMQERPDFARIHHGSAFAEAPRKPFDAREAQEIMKQARLIERGTYGNRDKGQHGGVIGKSALRLLEVFLFVIWPTCRKGVFPSLAHIADKAQLSVRTVQTCLAVLKIMGFLTVTRRMKRVQTALGIMCQQDTNAYLLHVAKGLGAIGAALFGRSPPDGKNFQAKENPYILYGLLPSNREDQISGAGLVAPQPITVATTRLRRALRERKGQALAVWRLNRDCLKASGRGTSLRATRGVQRP
eukprot:gene1347-1798_t